MAKSPDELAAWVNRGNVFHIDYTLSQFGPWRPTPSLNELVCQRRTRRRRFQRLRVLGRFGSRVGTFPQWPWDESAV